MCPRFKGSKVWENVKINEDNKRGNMLIIFYEQTKVRDTLPNNAAWDNSVFVLPLAAVKEYA